MKINFNFKKIDSIFLIKINRNNKKQNPKSYKQIIFLKTKSKTIFES